MPGFGSGPFGREPFGEWKWSRRVLFEYIPEIDRQQDLGAGGLLETYSEALRPSFNALRRQIRDLENLRDPFKVRTKFSDVVTLRLGPRVEAIGVLEQRGIGARVDGLNQFIAPRGRFGPNAIGKHLSVTGSDFSINNITTTISSVVNSTTVITSDVLATDVGPLTWEVRPPVDKDTSRVTVQVRSGEVSGIKPGWILTDGEAEYSVIARRQFPRVTDNPLSLTISEGTDGLISAGGLFTSPTVKFSQKDVGRPLSISTSAIPENNNKWEIVEVTGTNTAVLTNSADDVPTLDAGPFFWAMLSFPELDLEGISEPSGTVELEGLEGTIISSSIFKTTTEELTVGDIGKILTLKGCSFSENNGAHVISSVNGDEITVQSVLNWPDSGILVEGIGWDTRSATGLLGTFAEGILTGTGNFIGGDTITIGVKTYTMVTILIDVDGNVQVGITLQESLSNIRAAINLDSGAGSAYAASTSIHTQVVASNTLSSLIVKSKIAGSSSNTIETAETSDFASWSSLTLLGGSGKTDSDVTVRPTSLIDHLAKDFGIEIDQQESEDRQRSWVANVSRWIQQKGTPKAYEILGAISGFNITVSELYRVTTEIAEALPDVLEIGESLANRSGTDGTLLSVGINVRFSSPTAFFSAGDEGSHIRVRGAIVPDNNDLYTIASRIDENTVELRITDVVSLPESNNGSLSWAVVRLYTDNPPALPNFDEIDDDFMETVIDGLPPQTTDRIAVDKYCWENDFFSDVEVEVSSFSQISPGVFEVTTSDGPPQGPSGITGNASVVVGVRNWSLLDASGREFFVETVPMADGSDFKFQIKAALPPSVGIGVLRYNCPTVLSCDYCKSSRVLATIVADSILNESGVAVERALERVILRLEDVVPSHVVLVPRFSQTIECRLNLSVNTDVRSIDTVMYSPLSASFDDVQADILVSDPNNTSSDIHTSAAGQLDRTYTGLVLRCSVERTV